MRNCKVCDKALSTNTKGVLCRACTCRAISADPEVRRKKRESYLRHLDDPANRAALCERNRRAMHTKLANPAFAGPFLKRFVEEVQPLSVGSHTREDKVRAAHASAEKRMAWCPGEFRDDYRRMVKAGYKAAEARQIIHAHIAAKSPPKAKPETLSPFERQERALREGAALQDNVKVDRFSHYTAERAAKIA